MVCYGKYITRKMHVHSDKWESIWERQTPYNIFCVAFIVIGTILIA